MAVACAEACATRRTANCVMSWPVIAPSVGAPPVPASQLRLTASDTLRWYRSSAGAERGFCMRCGGNLFWRETAPDSTHVSIMAGTLDVPTGLRLAQHIFVADKSDYYEINDGVPQSAHW